MGPMTIPAGAGGRAPAEGRWTWTCRKTGMLRAAISGSANLSNGSASSTSICRPSWRRRSFSVTRSGAASGNCGADRDRWDGAATAPSRSIFTNWPGLRQDHRPRPRSAIATVAMPVPGRPCRTVQASRPPGRSRQHRGSQRRPGRPAEPAGPDGRPARPVPGASARFPGGHSAASPSVNCRRASRA